jgi:hypothetical protein
VSARRGHERVERRRGPRYDPEELAQPVFVVGSRLLNIGRDGLMIEAPVPLPLESTLHLHLVVGTHKAEVDARVRGCVPRAEGRRRAWGVGLEFEWMTEPSRQRLAQALVRRGRLRA